MHTWLISRYFPGMTEKSLPGLLKSWIIQCQCFMARCLISSSHTVKEVLTRQNIVDTNYFILCCLLHLLSSVIMVFLNVVASLSTACRLIMVAECLLSSSVTWFPTTKCTSTFFSQYCKTQHNICPYYLPFKQTVSKMGTTGFLDFVHHALF